MYLAAARADEELRAVRQVVVLAHRAHRLAPPRPAHPHAAAPRALRPRRDGVVVVPRVPHLPASVAIAIAIATTTATTAAVVVQRPAPPPLQLVVVVAHVPPTARRWVRVCCGAKVVVFMYVCIRELWWSGCGDGW